MSLFDFLRRHAAGLIVGLILSGLYVNQFMAKTYIEIDLKTYINHKAPVQVFWADEGEPFSKDRVKTQWIFHQDNVLRMRVGDLSGNARLRIDPLRYRGHVRINSLFVDHSGYKPEWFKSARTLAALKPVNDISSAVLEEDGLVITTSGPDSQLVMDMALEKLPGIQWHHWINLALIMVAGIIVVPWLVAGFSTMTYVPAGLFLVLLMAVAMATMSKPTVHPDEKTHFKSIKYYQHHNLPPAVDAPEMVYTYSEYGNSRLVGNEVYYPLAGFYVRLLEDLKLPMVVTSRSFSILMLMIVLLCAIYSLTFRVIATPLLMTSQAWYHYSYANSDMFAITVCLLIAWMSVAERSPLNRFLLEEKPRFFWLKMTGLGVVLGSLLFLKINYYVFALFVAVYYFWRLGKGDFERPAQVLARGALITLMGLSLLGVKYVYDGVINDWDRAERVYQMWDKYADHHYKPSTPLEEKHPEMYLRERGKNLGEMFTEFFWGGKTFLTSFGGYGFTQFFAKPGYYDWLKRLLFLTIAVVCGAVLLRGPTSLRVFLFITIAFVLLAIGISLTASWIRVLQPQGRYLAAILPMVGMFYFHARSCLPERIWHGMVLSLFVMATYSFLFVGLADIQKINF
ncbi:MAG: hypothetical protein KTR18_02820 [Acidiferrobacterales bacterium]|nr:hypothetical protein [Acidiferrobacterales bacterium]